MNGTATTYMRDGQIVATVPHGASHSDAWLIATGQKEQQS